VVSLYPTHQLDAWYVELLACGAVSGRPLSANSVRHIHSVLHRALEQGIAWDWIAHNPARRASPPPARRLHIAGQIAHTATGPVTRPTKTYAERRLTLDPATLAELDAHASLRGGLKMDQFIFTHDPEGMTPWRPDYATLAFARLAARLGIAEIRLHDLRHFAATTMLLNGIDVRTAAGRLGHASASTTLDVYAHYSQPADLRASDTLADSLDGHR
jgi:integrase